MVQSAGLDQAGVRGEGKGDWMTGDGGGMRKPEQSLVGFGAKAWALHLDVVEEESGNALYYGL